MFVNLNGEKSNFNFAGNNDFNESQNNIKGNFNYCLHVFINNRIIVSK